MLSVDPFEIRTQAGKRTWRQLLGIGRDLVLALSWHGMVADEVSSYLFARCTGHFVSLMPLASRSCYRPIRTTAESLASGLLDDLRIDQAAEDTLGQPHSAIEGGRLPARPGAAGLAAGKAALP